MVNKRGLLKATGTAGIIGLAGCIIPSASTENQEDTPESGETQESTPESEETQENSNSEPENEESSQPPIQLSQEFKFEANNSFEVTPAVSAGKLLAPNTDRKLYSIDVPSGDLSWSHEFNEEIGATPAVSENTVFTNKEMDNKMYSFDINSGKINWNINPEYGLHPDPPAYNGEFIFFSGEGVKAYNAETGQEEWDFDYDGSLYVSSRVTLSDQNVINTGEYGLFAVNQEDGTKEWSFEGSGEASPDSLVTNQSYTIYSDDSGTLYVIDAESGEVVHKISTSRDVISTISLINNVIYFADDGLRAFSLENMEELWNTETSIYNLSEETIDNYIFATTRGKLLIIDISNGDKILSKDSSVSYDVAPVIANDYIVIADNSNSLVGYQISEN